MSKALDSVPTTRLQNMRLKLQIYDFSITYVPAKKVILADLLSRRPCFGDKQEESEDYGCNSITAGWSSITLDHGGENDGDIQLQELKDCAAKCDEYQHLIKCFNMYRNRQDLRRRAKKGDVALSYSEAWDEISLEQGLLIKEAK